MTEILQNKNAIVFSIVDSKPIALHIIIIIYANYSHHHSKIKNIK